MRILTTALILTTAMLASAYAMDDTQVRGVQEAIKGMGCTVADSGIAAQQDGGFKAEGVMCDDGKYNVYLDKDFKVVDKDGA